jgi:hypothetical protein
MTKRGLKFKAALARPGVFLPAPARYEVGMRFMLAAGLILVISAPRARADDDAQAALCRSNPAYSPAVMRSVLEAQLEKDHDPALDAESPDQLATEAVEQGVKDCATDLRQNPAVYKVLAPLTGSELPVAWDAYNTACSDRSATKADCIMAEVGSVRALKHMMATDQPPGSKALVESCELVLTSDPAMADWRVCVDTALAAHADPDRARQCKTAVPWHVAKTGAEAGKILRACLQKAS